MKDCKTIHSIIVPVIVTIVVLPAIVFFLKKMELIDCLQSWPAVVFLAGTLFVYPMFLVLCGLSSLIGRAGTLEIFGIKWSATELDKVIVEREELRAKVIIVDSGLEKRTRESAALLSSVQTPDSKTKQLPEKQRREVLASSFQLAAADQKITYHELEALRQVSEALDLDGRTFYEEYKDFQMKHGYVDFEAYVTSDGSIEKRE